MTTTNPSFKLRGLWAAMPTPWNARGGLDLSAIVTNVARLAAARVDGVYTADSDGEFYAIEAEEFRRLAETFGTAARKHRVPVAMGVTWTNMAGIIARTRYWVNTLPAWMRKYFDVCASEDWSSARRHFDKLEEWERTAIQPLREKNHRHAVLGKARSALTGWLQDNGQIQRPYHPIGAQELDQLRTKFRAYWREELALETFPSRAR
jgi:dihydrodipicolinate synthase/N-acetylneuraminate lyase